jgi:hypothetical protein
MVGMDHCPSIKIEPEEIEMDKTKTKRSINYDNRATTDPLPTLSPG